MNAAEPLPVVRVSVPRAALVPGASRGWTRATPRRAALLRVLALTILTPLALFIVATAAIRLLGWALVRERRAGGRVRAADVAAFLLVPAGLVAYLANLWLPFGNPVAFREARAAGWRVGFDWRLSGYWREVAVLATRRPRIQGYTQLLDTLRMLAPLAIVALTVAVFRRLGPPPGLYTAGVVGVGICVAAASVGREVLAAAPAFAVAGLRDRGAVDEGLRLLAFGLLLVLLAAFVTGHFVG